MIKKTIKYTDFNGNEQTEDVYFNLSKAEVIEQELSGDIGAEKGAWSSKLERIGNSKNGAEIIETFKEILKMSYGVRSEDGKRFIKSDELFEEFTQTEAYSELFFELTTNAESAAEFVRGIMPANLGGGATSNATPSELARAASQAALQGHNKKADHEASTITDVPELPTVSPDLEQEDLSKLTKEQLIERLGK